MAQENHGEIPKVAERLLRYVKVDTESDPESKTSPSVQKQLDLSRMLVAELRDLGCVDAALDDAGHVMATVPGNVSHAVPTIGFIAHVDTSPEMSGKDVKPQLHANYDGGAIKLNDRYTLTPEQSPELKMHLGHTIVTTDGTTLLGADNKAGIAEIMTLAERLLTDPSIKHGDVRIGFTRDEEIGRGTEGFDVDKFGAKYAYTVDGATVGHIENETFCADSADVVFHGLNVHPGSAKKRMVNALKMAAAFIDLLPKDKLSPETTECREGFVHPVSQSGTVDRAHLQFILRDFELRGIEAHRDLIETIAVQIREVFAPGRVDVRFSESYRNMRFVLDDHPKVVKLALDATKRAGIEPSLHPVRGGTDGSHLAFMGLPTPNVFTGGHMYHSRYEWVAVEGMLAAVETLTHLCALWAEQEA